MNALRGAPGLLRTLFLAFVLWIGLGTSTAGEAADPLLLLVSLQAELPGKEHCNDQ